MPKVTVPTHFDCSHTADVEVDIDADVQVPGEVRGLGKCGECMEEGHLIPISGVQPLPSGALQLDSIFLMPLE